MKRVFPGILRDGIRYGAGTGYRCTALVVSHRIYIATLPGYFQLAISRSTYLFLQVVCERIDVFPLACAIARVFPIYSRKTGASNSKRTVTVEFLLVGGESDQPLSKEDLETLSNAAHGIRTAAKIVDAPCADMHTDIFLEVIVKSCCGL